MKSWLLLPGLLLLTTGPLHAQIDTTQARRAELLQRLSPGTRLRVLTRGEQLTGELQRVSTDTLRIDGRAIATRDVTAAWLQQRSTRKGMKIGALIGAPAGAAMGAFYFWLASALCEASCTDFTAGRFAVVALGSAVFGTIAGGTVGAITGAAIPQWLEITDARVRLPTGDPRTIGAVSLMPALAHSPSTGSGFGARGSYTFQTTHAALGFELGKYGLGDDSREIFIICENRTELCTDTITVSTSVVHGGGILRLGAGADRRVEPFASLGIGLYSWGSGSLGAIQLGGYSLGGGVNLRSRRGGRGVFAEARWQSNLTRSGAVQPHYGFYTIGIGGTLAW